MRGVSWSITPCPHSATPASAVASLRPCDPQPCISPGTIPKPLCALGIKSSPLRAARTTPQSSGEGVDGVSGGGMDGWGGICGME